MFCVTHFKLPCCWNVPYCINKCAWRFNVFLNLDGFTYYVLWNTKKAFHIVFCQLLNNEVDLYWYYSRHFVWVIGFSRGCINDHGIWGHFTGTDTLWCCSKMTMHKQTSKMPFMATQSADVNVVESLCDSFEHKMQIRLPLLSAPEMEEWTDFTRHTAQDVFRITASVFNIVSIWTKLSLKDNRVCCCLEFYQAKPQTPKLLCLILLFWKTF